MANFRTLIAEIQQYIKSNLAQAITGPVLQQVLLDMVGAINQLKQDTLKGYSFYGQPLAPGGSVSVTQNTFFLVGPGTYTINGTAYVVSGAGVSVLVYDCVEDEVSTAALFPYDAAPTEGSANGVTSGGVKTALNGVAAEAAAAIEHAKGAAGLAEALLDTDSEGAEQEFSLRKGGGDGGAYFRRLLGNTKAFNQLVQARASTTALSLTLTNNGDGSISITGTADTTTNLTISTLFARATGSRYFCSVGAPIGASQQVSVGGTPFSAGATMGIYTASATGNVSMAISVVSGETYNLKLWPVVIDLTAMQDNSATPEEFREKYPLLYYAYGRKLIHCKVAKVITKGANQWDEKSLGGKGYSTSTGALVNATNRIASENPVRIFGGTEYYAKFSGTSTLYLLFYDADMNFISYTFKSASGTFTPPANAAYLHFMTYNDYGEVYKNDICINLSDAEINGQYFPYWERELALDITNQEDTDGNKPFAEGMMSAGSAADYANEVGGAKVMGVVDLGSLDWIYVPVSEPYPYGLLRAEISDKAMGYYGLICAKYINIASFTTDKVILGVPGNRYIYVVDSAYTDAATFKAAMVGEELVYELTTPVPFTWKEPLNTGIKVSKYGTEEITPAQTENIDTAPFRAVTTYSISVANLVAALSALGNRGGAKGLLGGGNQEENPGNGEGLTPEEESPKEEEQPKEEEPKEEETPVVEPEVQNKR